MIDFINIGPSPIDEECVQMGDADFGRRAKKECKAFANQLTRIWPDGDFRVKAFPHDFGTYYEVVAYFDTEDEHLTNIAFEAEANTPFEWDEEARKELA